MSLTLPSTHHRITEPYTVWDIVGSDDNVKAHFTCWLVVEHRDGSKTLHGELVSA